MFSMTFDGPVLKLGTIGNNKDLKRKKESPDHPRVALLRLRMNGLYRWIMLLRKHGFESRRDANVHFTVSLIEIGAGFGTPPVFVDEMVMM